ncbi:MAG: NAD(P)/FAD-dependent oxidoreductase [Longimicrobiales bacterium]
MSRDPHADPVRAPQDRAAPNVWDAVIVGAGPAGSTAAMILANRGHAVALIDRHDFPRDKTCGDALIPDTLRCLHRLGLYDRVRAHALASGAITVYSPARVAVDLPAEFITVRRRVFDDLLVREACARGAMLMRGHVTGIESPHAGPATVRVSARTAADRAESAVRAHIVVLATGADVTLLERCGMVERAEPSAFALRGYVQCDAVLDRLVVAFDRTILPGYAWIFPLPGGELNVGCGVFGNGWHVRQVGLRRTLDTFLREFPLARELFGSGESIGPLKGARLRCGLTGARPFRPPNILALGEAIGTTFPLTGEGIGKAMETAEIAAAVISDALGAGALEQLAQYPERVETLRSRYVGYRIAERWIRSAFLSNIVARRVRRSDRLRAAAAGVLNETVDPTRVFSARALLASVLPGAAAKPAAGAGR